jgi:REP element-mobilizing transposase RayT
MIGEAHRRRSPSQQLGLPFPNSWGGARKGAGRKPGPRPRTPHRARPRHSAAHPVHVTLRASFGPLRSQLLFPTIRLAIALATRRDPERYRIVHFSVQSDHLHLLVEAKDKAALSAGMRGLMVRIAAHVNELLMRRGRFWADRWHGRALASPLQVRHALVYVLANFRKHARRPIPVGIDPYSSGEWFAGWLGYDPVSGVPPALAGPRVPLGIADTGVPVASARTWLASVGWLRRGRIGPGEPPRHA